MSIAPTNRYKDLSIPLPFNPNLGYRHKDGVEIESKYSFEGKIHDWYVMEDDEGGSSVGGDYDAEEVAYR